MRYDPDHALAHQSPNANKGYLAEIGELQPWFLLKEATRWQAHRFALGNVGPLWVGGSPNVCLRPLIRADSGVHLSVSEIQDRSERPEIGELRPRPRSLLKETPLSIWGTGHHEMPFDAILGQYLDKGIPL